MKNSAPAVRELLKNGTSLVQWGVMKRLTERFPEGCAVEIQFAADTEQRWWTGTIAAHQHPGVWVQMTAGNRFFVTNGKRIRLLKHNHHEA